VRSEKPRLCVVGHLLGRNQGYITTQGQILADHFVDSGYHLVSSSARINRFERLVDMILTVVQNRKTTDLLIVEIYSGLSFVMADAVSLVSSYLNIPTIGVLHGGNLPQFSRRFPRWTSRVLRRFAELVAPSAFLANEMEKYGFSATVIPNIVDVGAYLYKVRRELAPKLIWMRAFHPIYNPEMALGVLDVIRRDHPEATLVMAGVDKGLQRLIEKLAREMNLDDAVRFPGFLDLEAKIKEFSEADIYLNTNRIDNMPVTVVEACAMGLPVVATNVGGLPDLITHGKNGLLVSDGNVQEMAEAVNRLLKDSHLSEQISRNGRLLAERSSWPSVRKCWDEAFAGLLSRKSGAKRETASKLFQTS
jgi:glycosyltransferase involved in cell wall biosynthesis